MSVTNPPVSKEFFWRRLHSVMGLWMVIFLIEHLLTNSQAALLIGDDGSGLVRMVNWIKNLPYLPAIELLLLGVPFGIHMLWGIHYLFTGKSNSFKTDGSTPSLPEYPRNRAYTWQRITSWILLIAIVGHVVQMRFIEYPASAHIGPHNFYMVRLSEDKGLYPLSERLGVEIFTKKEVQQEKKKLLGSGNISEMVSKVKKVFANGKDGIEQQGEKLIQEQKILQTQEFVEALEKRPLRKGDVVAVASDFGTATLLMVRDTFKMPIMLVLYTLFVVAAVFHGFNGLWTFLITWGITLTERAQLLMQRLAVLLMVVICFFGLAAIWGTYWISCSVKTGRKRVPRQANLRH